ITLSFISGIILGNAFIYFPLSVLILSTISFIFILILNKGKRLKSLSFCLIGISAAFYFLFSATDLPENHISRFLNQEVVIKGRVLEPPQRGHERVTFILDVEEMYTGEERRVASGKVRLSGDIKGPLQYGDILFVRTKLKSPKGYHNPGGYNFEEALARDKVFASGRVKDKDIVRVGFGGNHLLRKIYEGRDDIRRAIENSLSNESSAILQSMVIGEDKGLTDEIRDAFMASGTTHILSISGSHLGLLAFLIYNIVRLSILRLPSRLLLRLTLYTSPSKIAALVTMPPVILYTIIAGGQVATKRSLIMILVYLFAILIEREERIINSLAFAAVIILILNPQTLFDISFQLSYGSILSIGYILDWWKGRRKGLEIELMPEKKGLVPRIKKRLTQYLLVAIAATLGTAPIVAYHFNQFSWVGLFSNIVIIPFAGAVIVPLGLLSGVLTIVTGSSTMPMASLIDKAVFLFYSVVNAFSGVPHAEIHLPSPSLPLIALYYLLLYTILEWKRNKLVKVTGVISASLIILFTLTPFLDNQSAGSSGKGIKVTFMDVGQGDSGLIELLDGKRMLIDGGGTFDKRSSTLSAQTEGFDIGKRVLAPYLWDKGIKRIDYIVLSHPASDHIGGLTYVIKKFEIGEVWINGDPAMKGFQEFLRIIEEKGIPVMVVKRGDALLRDGYNIYVLHPYPEFYPDTGKSSGQNNRSIVLKVVYKNRSFLFPGDIEKEAEDDLIHLGKWLKADIIKVPHHGSKTSSTEEFLSMVQPEVAVVSSGRDNIFKHPNPDVIERYERSGTRIYRTDGDGAVIIRSDGENLKVETFDTLSLKKISLQGNRALDEWWGVEVENVRRLWKGM
ncbi:MAG: DNA internalization-related competence protein ComEC/Rec2, partial [Nitrospirae bacterium]|nr:DNA internalization-related competence protein ComEC/Rec2 [Nitrospirota bacterium]